MGAPVLDSLRLRFKDAVRYWRDKSGREVDFVVRRPGGRVDAVEAKLSPDGFACDSRAAFRALCPEGRDFDSRFRRTVRGAAPGRTGDLLRPGLAGVASGRGPTGIGRRDVMRRDPASVRRPLAPVATAALLALVFGLSTTPGHAADDPNPGRNRVAEATADLPVSWDVASGEGVLWSADLGTVTYGGPTLAGDLVVVGTNNERPRDPSVTGDRGVVMAFDRRDGGFRWQITHAKVETGDANDWPLQGVCSTPSFDGERLHYVSNRGELVAANLDGSIAWQFDMLGEWGVFPKHMAASTPLVAGDLVFVVTSNGVTDDGRVPAPEAPSFAAFDRRTGRPVWRDASPGAGLLDGQWGSPAHGSVRGRDQAIFPAGDGWLYAFAPTTGEPLWRFDGNAAAGGAGGEASPGDDRHVFVATPVLHEGVVYLAAGRDPEASIRPGALWALDPTGSGDVTSTGVRWRFEDRDLGRAITTVAVADGVVYLADLNGFLFALDAGSGEKLWTWDALAPFWSSPLVAGGKVWAADTEGDVAVLRAGRTLDVLAENVMPRAVYTSPSTDGSVVFLATSDTLYALVARPSGDGSDG